jgi:hypothetical protein
VNNSCNLSSHSLTVPLLPLPLAAAAIVGELSIPWPDLAADYVQCRESLDACLRAEGVDKGCTLGAKTAAAKGAVERGLDSAAKDRAVPPRAVRQSKSGSKSAVRGAAGGGGGGGGSVPVSLQHLQAEAVHVLKGLASTHQALQQARMVALGDECTLASFRTSFRTGEPADRGGGAPSTFPRGGQPTAFSGTILGTQPTAHACLSTCIPGQAVCEVGQQCCFEVCLRTLDGPYGGWERGHPNNYDCFDGLTVEASQPQ